jgi:alkylhydroperoxidase/carboxymuconolactone decarboxylase family protein YurZ
MASDYEYDDPALARGAAMFRSVFGEEYGGYLARQLHEGAVSLNRFVMTQVAPNVWERDGLPMTTRLLIAISVLAAHGRDDVKFFMRGALAQGVTRQEIEEALIITGLETGFPNATLGARNLDAAEKEHAEFMAAYAAEKKKGKKI